ncbi:family 10 glycosylhydrolase [Paenibacillus sp. JNUCC32]|uniref:family 10 glycosylhydrolase n=1 Tax=Paenibacillus sp. JNUCC32 TaxID=2777984 RepID=UPI001E2C617D|nr:family 10 glycosylhydrolase [Paenibacillus sp. JNUCC-32]
MKWWSTNRLRLIQNNLRETDADMDVDLLIRELKSFQANVLMMNAGGIFAFYPSSLMHQYVTPYLTKDLLGEAVEKAHANGLRFIARFDFSKAHESLWMRYPEWFYRDREGREVNYHGIVHTCLNGVYQQVKSLESIQEVLERYPVDGIFFNMFGYQHWDYSGNFYGPCYCPNCRLRFREVTGEDLLAYTGPEHPMHELYRSFQERTSREMLERIHGFVKSLRSDVAISTYHPHRVDIVRKESNTSLKRSGQPWLYSASENVASIQDSWDDKLVSNCSINAIDLAYRFTGVSENENAIRLYQSIGSGSGLDFCIIGAFEGYPDRASFETVKDIFRYHAEHEELFGQLGSMAEAALVKPAAPEAAAEYHGMFKMLKEEHVLFDVVMEEQLVAMESKLMHMRAVILPGVQGLSVAAARALHRAADAGAVLVATGTALERQPELLKEWFAASFAGVKQSEPGAYLDVSDKSHFPGFAHGRDWIVAGGSFARVAFDPDTTECRLPFIEPSTFGPPERAYGHRIGADYGLGLHRRVGKQGTVRTGVYMPWNPGELYYRHGFEDYRQVMADVLHDIVPNRVATTNAPPCLELFVHRLKEGGCLVQLLNLSGYNGTTFMNPLPLYDVQVELTVDRVDETAVANASGSWPQKWMLPRNAVARGRLLRAESDAQVETSQDRVTVTLPQIGRYEAVWLQAAPVGDRKELITSDAKA